jgi:G3E family GTPase
MKTTVVCGLLGSGKTTFVRNFLKGRTEKTVVLVNDFGSAGIDGEIFSADGIESVELPSGCVCCTLRFDLITTIRKIVSEFSPDHLVIEPSGVASPSGVLEALESAGAGPAAVVGIVDAAEFAELYESGMYGSFFEDQITKADMILVNKTDLAEEEKIAEAERLIESINPRAIVLRSVNAEVQGASLPLPVGERGIKTGAKLKGPSDHFHFDSVSISMKPGAELTVIKKLLKDLSAGSYGSIVRAKALVQTGQGPFRLDLAYGKVSCESFDRDIEQSRVVIIGEGLDEQGIRQALETVAVKQV